MMVSERKTPARGVGMGEVSTLEPLVCGSSVQWANRLWLHIEAHSIC